MSEMDWRFYNFIAITSLLLSIVVLLFVLIACTTGGTKRFNNEDQQDGMCYGEYGGEFGYCTRSPK